MRLLFGSLIFMSYLYIGRVSLIASGDGVNDGASDGVKNKGTSLHYKVTNKKPQYQIVRYVI